MSEETGFRLHAVTTVLAWMFAVLSFAVMWLGLTVAFNRAPWSCGITLFLAGVGWPKVIGAFWNKIPGGKS